MLFLWGEGVSGIVVLSAGQRPVGVGGMGPGIVMSCLWPARHQQYSLMVAIELFMLQLPWL